MSLWAILFRTAAALAMVAVAYWAARHYEFGDVFGFIVVLAVWALAIWILRSTDPDSDYETEGEAET